MEKGEERGGRNVEEKDVGMHGEEKNWEEFARAYIFTYQQMKALSLHKS